MGNQQDGGEVSQLEFSWLAGMLNGDGCFSLTFAVRKNENIKCDLSLTLTQCDPALIEKTVDILNRIGINPAIQEYASSDGSKRTRYNLRVNKMAHIARVIDSILPYMAGEKRAQASLMRRYIERRMPFTLPNVSRKDAAITNDPVALKIARDFYDARHSLACFPKEVAKILNDYPAREYGQAAGSAQHAQA